MKTNRTKFSLSYGSKKFYYFKEHTKNIQKHLFKQ
jgi:hypothetical protein